MNATDPTHYEILGLTPSILNESRQDPTTLLKKAYHGALLRHHPDKQPSSSSSSIPLYTASDSISGFKAYTVDQIATAFAVLSSPGQRTEYDAILRQSQALAGSATPKFQTGVENVDLDDLPFDEEMERWHRSCRCGNDRGYLFGEDDLVEVEDEGVLLVGCQDCSLWLRVHFVVLDDVDAASKESIINKS